MKIRSVGAELFRAGRHDEPQSCYPQLCERACNFCSYCRNLTHLGGYVSGVNKLHITLVNNTPSAHVPPSNVTDEVSYSYKTMGKISSVCLNVHTFGQQPGRQKTVY